MVKKSEIIFSTSTLQLYVVGSMVALFLLFAPLLARTLTSLFSWLFFAIVSLIFLVFYSAIIEYAVAFIKSIGGLFSYLSFAYARWIAYLSATFLLLGTYILILFISFQFLGSLFSPLESLGILLLFIIGFHILLYEVPLKSKRILYILFFIVLVLAIGVFLVSLLEFSTVLPVFKFSFDLWAAQIFLLLVLLILIALPFTLLSHSVDAVDEVLPDILSLQKKLFVFGFLPLVFLLSGTPKVLSILSLPFLSSSFTFYTTPILYVSLIVVLSFILITLSLYFFMVLPKLIFALAKEKLFFPFLAKDALSHPKRSFLFQGTLLSILAVLFFFVSFSPTVIFLILFIFALIVILLLVGIPFMHWRLPDLERPFAIKRYKLFPLLAAIIGLIGLIIFVRITFQPILFIFVFALIVLSVVYYGFERYHNETMAKWSGNLFFWSRSFIDSILYSKKIQKELHDLVGDLSGKTVLDLGCKTGFLSKRIFAFAKPKTLFLTDISSRSLAIAIKNVSSLNLPIKLYSLTDYQSSIHPSVSHLDFVFSANTFFQFSYVNRVLKQLNVVMKPRSRFVIIDISQLFCFSLKWLNQANKVKKIFTADGFEVDVSYRRRWFGKLVIIKGVKAENVELLHSWYDSSE